MNKAEEQYLYWWGREGVKTELMSFAFDRKRDMDFKDRVRRFLHHRLNEERYTKNFLGDKNSEGRIYYLTTIIHAIENNVITDWPTFVTYMTGEMYEG